MTNSYIVSRYSFPLKIAINMAPFLKSAIGKYTARAARHNLFSKTDFSYDYIDIFIQPFANE
ncbi:MAG: hypothetical protein CM15mV25_1870 [uncultured marine virus]|nr:MAG: hypothetical protein CM15mV25_1870 [uncultured marine virus]